MVRVFGTMYYEPSGRIIGRLLCCKFENRPSSRHHMALEDVYDVECFVQIRRDKSIYHVIQEKSIDSCADVMS